MKKVAVLISTYNGAQFLNQQLRSIVNQSFQDFRIFIRDDGSTDQSFAIINKFAEHYPQKVIILPRSENIGIRLSFEQLMLFAKDQCDLFFFSDQDDIWHERKLEILLSNYYTIKDAEKTPVMLFSDMNLSQEGKIKTAFYSKIPFFKRTIKANQLNRGYISGCLMLFNKACCESYFTFPRIWLHDHHIFMIARLFGRIVFVAEPFITHEIHSTNAIGHRLRESKLSLIKTMLRFTFNNHGYRQIILNSYFQMIEGYSCPENKKLLVQNKFYSLIEVQNLNYWKRKVWYFKHFLPFRQGYLNGIVELICI